MQELALGSTNNDETQLIVDSGAPVDVRSNCDLNPVERVTIRKSKDASEISMANATVCASGEATVYVKDLDMFVEVQ